ncbi:Imm1 family immunity protein [Streptomyces griseorubiginosus]|uniref:Imm1 family immunity protein n=1 Tax=Streptomyces griseorubiginosus TaxID=67304 RepID=UPI002E7FCF4A|nr:Imm1 family immunity protein [Streptomyces griseorubiginosus]WUB44195.1 Imm1 family immunity protein [Streptomyces griseorubiginosus]WUB52713.1 Imm1 family immunity protein [Streptomyces griseorubiginosus]
MALKVLGETPLFLESQSEVRAYLDVVFAEGSRLKSSVELAFQVIWDVASDKVYASTPDNVLSIGINFSSEYAGILWYCEGTVSHRVSAEVGHDVANHAWVSLNPTAPDSDPKVLSDPGCPTFFDRVSALPLSSIRPVVEEYFRAGTGFRPTQVQWTKGHYTGELYVEEDEA